MNSISVWLWLACTQMDDVVQQQLDVHTELATLRELYQKASSLYTDGQYSKAVEQFRALHILYPHSRSVLEGLLLSELHDPENVQVGYARIQSYTESHPGDVDFRLIQSKFHLQTGAVEKGRADLDLLLFNQAIHPWILAQDSFLRQYQDVLNIDKLPFTLIRVIEVDAPTVSIVNDTIDVRVSFLHLSNCKPYIPPFEIGLDLQPKRLTVYQKTVDETVVNTTFVQSITNRSAATSEPVIMNIQCGAHSVDVTLPGIEVIELPAAPISPKQSRLQFPDLSAIKTVDTGVPWTLYINHVESKKGFWNPSIAQ